MTQFLPAFPAFIARRFSRTSNDEESPLIRIQPDDSTITPNHEVAPSVSPTLEEEELAIRSVDQENVAPEETGSCNQPTSAQDIPLSTELHVRNVANSRISDVPAEQSIAAQFWRRGARGHTLPTDGETLSSSSQAASVGLRSHASSVSSSIQSAHEGPVDALLPEDDGMAAMRARIVGIQNGSVSSEEKARQMLALMTERYSASRVTSLLLRSPEANFPPGFRGLEIHNPANPNHSIEAAIDVALSPITSPSSPNAGIDRSSLTAEDRQPTYYRRTRQPSNGHSSSGRGLDMGAGSEEAEEDPVPYGCLHYKRNIKLQCSTCSRWYTCRFCHDAVEDHKLVRRETKNMLCMFCNCVQQASGVCTECDQSAAWYYCDVCKLWDDNPNRSIYHCDDCGICRVGEGLGKDFHHCQTCGVCLEIKIAESHRCIERSTDCDCPICGDYMFTSPEKVVFMKCGHSIHEQCYHEHIRRSYRCPICSRSVLNMEAHFQHLKRLIEAQPMPPHLQDTRAWVCCNDCSAKTTVKYHWLGYACDVCDSFNTALLRILKVPDSDTAPSVDTVDVQSAEATPQATDPHVGPVSRGRGSLSGGQTMRSGASASAVDAATTAISHDNGIQRNMHSASPVLRSQPPGAGAGAGFSDSLVSDDEEDIDEVAFWGGSPSPSGRFRSPSSREIRDSDDHRDGSNAGSSGNDDLSDTENDSMSDDYGSDESDEMDLVGHV